MRHLALALAALALVAACSGPAAPTVTRDPNWTPRPTPTCDDLNAKGATMWRLHNQARHDGEDASTWLRLAEMTEDEMAERGCYQ